MSALHPIPERWRHFIYLVLLTCVLYLAGGLAMASVAGWHLLWVDLKAARWWWVGVAVVGVPIGFAGYYIAYRGIQRAEGGGHMRGRRRLAVVVAAYGGLLGAGGGTLDRFAMLASGHDIRQAKVRVTALTGLEQGMLALIVCPVAIAALLLGVHSPRPSFTWPWATIPPAGFAVAMWAAERHRDRLREHRGLLGAVSIFADAVHIVYVLFKHPLRNGLAVLGMLIYWLGEMFVLWAGLQAFDQHISPVTAIVVLGTGMLVTRRTAPLGGAGLLLVALVLTFRYGTSVPYAPATLGVALYCAFTLWVPMPSAFLALPELRSLVEESEEPKSASTGRPPNLP